MCKQIASLTAVVIFSVASLSAAENVWSGGKDCENLPYFAQKDFENLLYFAPKDFEERRILTVLQTKILIVIKRF